MNRRQILGWLMGVGFCPATVFAQDSAVSILDRGMKSLQEKVDEGRNFRGKLNGLREAALSRNDAAAVADLRKLAAEGNVSAMVFVGYLLDRGLGGLKADPYRGAQYFQAAAKLGDGVALYDLGQVYMRGRGIRADTVIGERFMVMAAKERVKHAAVILGRLFEERKQWSEAGRWYQQAVGHREHDEATYKYGLFLFKGMGHNRSVKEGMLLLARACDTWNPQAMLALAEIYANGLGVPVNFAEAMKWAVILQQNPRPYDHSLANKIIPAGTLDDISLESVQRAAKVWMDAHPVVQPKDATDYSTTIWES